MKELRDHEWFNHIRNAHSSIHGMRNNGRIIPAQLVLAHILKSLTEIERLINMTRCKICGKDCTRQEYVDLLGAGERYCPEHGLWALEDMPAERMPAVTRYMVEQTCIGQCWLNSVYESLSSDLEYVKLAKHWWQEYCDAVPGLAEGVAARRTKMEKRQHIARLLT